MSPSLLYLRTEKLSSQTYWLRCLALIPGGNCGCVLALPQMLWWREQE
jgi:hypothetical protein